VPGIGEETARTLLKHFKSVTRIKEASVDTLSAVIGRAKAKVIVDFYQGSTPGGEDEVVL
jgi:excinuclease ABC subunit C